MNNKNLLHNNFNYIFTEPNIFNRRNLLIQNNKNENKNHNNIKYLNRFRSSIKLNKKNNNINDNINNKVNTNDRNRNIYSAKKQNVFDVRIYLCLKMLGLSHILNKFENNNINFNDLLILSIKDLERLNIQKNDIIRIKRFTLDYIKNASYYSSEELEKYFVNKNIKKNYRKAISVGNLRRNQMMGFNKVVNGYNILNNNRYDSNNYRNQIHQEKYNSTSNYNNNYIYNIYKNREINTENNGYGTKKILNPNYNNYINNIYSKPNNIDMHYYNALTYNSNDRNNLEQFYNSNCDDIIDKRKTKLQKNNLNKYYSQTKLGNPKINKNKNIKELNENQKKKINHIFSNKINSIRNRKNNKNLNNNSSINNAKFLNENEFNMFSQIQKMKKNSNKNLIKQKISNKNITNTKINNYINNIYNINKNPQGKNIKAITGKSYRNKLIQKNEIIMSNNNKNNLNQLKNQNFTSKNNKEKNFIDYNYNNKIDNFDNFYFYNRERNMTLSNENRMKNLTYKNNIMKNNINYEYYPY